jgi:predicted ATPase
VTRDLPSGTVTFLFTDIEGSTRLLHELGDAYVGVLAEHRRILREAAAAHRGVEVDTQGDAFFFAFARAPDAAGAARVAQDGLATGPIRVRMGIHTGQPILTEEGYVGLDVHKGARIAAAGHGAQVLLSEATRQLVDAAVRDLGLHRLKDLQAPERIYQLGDADFPPLKTLNQTNLPVQPTQFLGRERELTDILELLRRDDVRLLTLTGPGGTGKTRLGLQAAAELVEEYPDGVWFVGLAALTDPALVLPTIAQTLGIREGAGASYAQALADHLRVKRALLALDNLEQLLPDAAPELAELLLAAPKVDFITSSRERLHLSGEHEYPVPPLSLDEATLLFVERARATRPEFEVDSSRPAIEAICIHLDRLPLAIELAAARVKLLPPEKLLDRLERRLPLLTGGTRDAPERQRTLRATIAWSYDLLSEDEQHLFACMGIFAGGCTLQAAEEICDADLDTLQSLIDKSLVRSVHEANGDPRYVMLETIREYALERLAGRSEPEGPRARHEEYFLALAEAAEPALRGRDQALWLERLEVEHDNIRSALTWALAQSECELGLRLSSALWRFWYMHAHVTEGRRWIARALACGEPVATEARARALDGAGYLAGEQGDGEARALLEASLSCARQLGSPATVAMAATHLSLYLPVDQADEALTLGEEAVSLAREAGDRWTLALALNNLGEIARELGESERATTLYEESYLICRELGDASRMSLCLGNLGEMAFMAGNTQRARSLLSEAVDLARELGDKRHLCYALGDLGWVALEQARLEESNRLFRESLSLSRELGSRQFSVETLPGLAAVAAAGGETARAARLAGSADALERLVGRPPTPLVTGVHERYLDAARGASDRADWERAWAEGGAMGLDEAIDYALSED